MPLHTFSHPAVSPIGIGITFTEIIEAELKIAGRAYFLGTTKPIPRH
jgi:hypothetical protein